MPKTHTPKSTAPDGESPEKPTMIDHPAPDGESPGTELGTKPEIRDGGERLTRIITEFGRLATGRLFYESKTGNSQTPESLQSCQSSQSRQLMSVKDCALR